MIPQNQCQKDFQEWFKIENPTAWGLLLDESIDRDGTYHNPSVQKEYEAWIAAFKIYNGVE